MSKWILIILPVIMSFESSWAIEQNGVQFADQIKVGEQTLVLNGTGTRKATFLKVKVYAAALYVAEKSSDPAVVLAQTTVKRIQMTFLRSVDEKKVVNTWKESLLANNAQGGGYIASLEQLTTGLGDLNKGNSLLLTLTADSAVLEATSGFKSSVAGPGFGMALQRIWLGPNPPDNGLQAGLLGRAEADN